MIESITREGHASHLVPQEPTVGRNVRGAGLVECRPSGERVELQRVVEVNVAVEVLLNRWRMEKAGKV